tara:strand:- start:114547 stop:116154 length:1608 start_codon:yes stop_codon:yes gene_type:complete
MQQSGMKIGPKAPEANSKPQVVENIKAMASSSTRFQVSTIKGPNLMTQAQSVDDVRAHIQKCGFMIRQTLIYSNRGTTIHALFYYCQSKHGDMVLIRVPNLEVFAGDINLIPMRSGLNLVSDAVKKTYTDLHDTLEYDSSYAFVTYAGIQYFPSHGGEYQGFTFSDMKFAQHIFKTRENFYDCVPAIEFSRLQAPERINTLSMGFSSEYLSERRPKFVKLVQELNSEIGLIALFDADAMFTVIIPPENTIDPIMSADIETKRQFIGSHVLVGRFEPAIADEKRTIMGTRTITGLSVSLLYEGGLLKKIRSDPPEEQPKSNTRDQNTNMDKTRSTPKKTLLNVSETIMHKYNGVVYSVSGAMPMGKYEFDVPEFNDLGSVITLFDLTTQNLKIKNVAYYQGTVIFEDMVTDMGLLQKSLENLLHTMYTKLSEQGNELYSNLGRLQSLFYSRDVPCQTGACVTDYSELRIQVLRNNKEFERLSNISRKLGSIKVETEKFALELMKVKQELDVDNILETVKNFDLEEVDYFAKQEEAE